MPVILSQDFSKVETQHWRVLPIVVGKALHWYDPAGILLATSDKPSIWGDSFLWNYDFILDTNQKVVSTEPYLAFR